MDKTNDVFEFEHMVMVGKLIIVLELMYLEKVDNDGSGDNNGSADNDDRWMVKNDMMNGVPTRVWEFGNDWWGE